MTSEAERFGVWQRLTTILWFLLAVGFVLALPVLLGLTPWSMAIVVGAAVIIAMPIAAVTKWALRHSSGKTLVRRWAVTSVALVFGLSILAAAPIYYLSAMVAARPLTVPQAVISNGQRTIIFQGMMHVGSEAFYKGVVYDLEHAIADDYVIYYEGVRPDPAGDRWFSETLADGGDLNSQYKKLGRVCGLSFQGEYFQLLASDIREHPDRHVAADVTTLEMKQEYERLIAVDKSFAQRVKDAAKDKAETARTSEVFAKFLNWSQDGNPQHRTLGGIVCRGVMDIVLARNAPTDLDPLVLDYRNRVLVDRILADPRPRIYVNYGSGHLSGMLRLLQASDPKWKIVSVKWMRAIEVPEDLQGQI